MKIKKKTIQYTVVTAIIAEVISIPVAGGGALFPYGLALGVAVALVNLNIIGATIDKAVACGKKTPVTFGLILRILLYAAALVVAVRTSYVSGIGAAVGFLLPRVSLYVYCGILPALRRRLGLERAAVYVTDMSSNLFVKDPRFARYHNGREYLTYRHYRKVRVADSR